MQKTAKETVGSRALADIVSISLSSLRLLNLATVRCENACFSFVFILRYLSIDQCLQ